MATNAFNAGDRMTSSDSGAVTYGYDSPNRLTSVTGGESFSDRSDCSSISD